MLSKIIKVNQSVTDIFPNNKKYFTVEEISFRLDGIVQPVFFKDVWFFYNPNGLKMNLNYNYEAARLLGFPIYGDCIYIEQNLLPSYFFIDGLSRDDEGEPIVDEDEDDEYDDGDIKDFIDRESDLQEIKKMEDEIKYLDKHLLKNSYDISYTAIFHNGFTFSELIKNKIVSDMNGQNIRLSTLNSYYKYLYSMYAFYIKNDEFDKCEKLVELINYTKKYIPDDKI